MLGMLKQQHLHTKLQWSQNAQMLTNKKPFFLFFLSFLCFFFLSFLFLLFSTTLRCKPWHDTTSKHLEGFKAEQQMMIVHALFNANLHYH